MTTNIDRAEIIAQVATRLSTAHPEWDPQLVEQVATAELDKIADSPVQDFLLVLTERATKKRLKHR